ncbi:F-box protein SKP2B-like [Vicia villosa]|uniref:F-box protein SKP2B-like n=1 Tax=Vicia villosa TaxID=3911 RepID=UPI00273CB1BF|nr:F-box protein SKP2B-like [Vicia villosa]
MKTCLKYEAEFHLSDDYWEHVFTFLINRSDGNTQDNNKFHFKSLSLVSKRFLSITNTLLLSLTISSLLLSLPTTLLHRFSNLNSLNLSFTVRLIPITSHFIHSLLPLKALTSLTLSRWTLSDNFLYAIAREALPLRRFVLQNCTGYTYHGIYSFLSKCQTIRHLGLLQDYFLNNHHIADLSLILPGLVSINLSRCWNLTESALFALISNCRSLSEITMECINFQNSHSWMDFDVIPQLKSLCLAYSWLINDEAVIMFASVLPNLQLLDLSYCYCISENGVIKVIERCTELKKIDLRYCKEVDADAIVLRTYIGQDPLELTGFRDPGCDWGFEEGLIHRYETNLTSNPKVYADIEIVSAHRGKPKILEPADLNIYEAKQRIKTSRCQLRTKNTQTCKSMSNHHREHTTPDLKKPKVDPPGVIIDETKPEQERQKPANPYKKKGGT